MLKSSIIIGAIVMIILGSSQIAAATVANRPAINPDFDPDESCLFDITQDKCEPGSEHCPDISGYDYDGYESQNTNFFPEAGTKEFNDIKDCVDNGYEDGRNEPFSRDRHGECDVFGYLEVNPYYDAFINGCISVEGNTEEDCERNTDSACC